MSFGTYTTPFAACIPSGKESFTPATRELFEKQMCNFSLDDFVAGCLQAQRQERVDLQQSLTKTEQENRELKATKDRLQKQVRKLEDRSRQLEQLWEEEKAERHDREQKLQAELLHAKKEVDEQNFNLGKLRMELVSAKDELVVARDELALAEEPEIPRFLWQWQGGSGEWHPYIADENKRLTEAFLQEEESCEIVRDGIQYEIKLADQKGWQRNCTTQTVREIRLSIHMPEHWSWYSNEIIKWLKKLKRPQHGSRNMLTTTFDAVAIRITQRKYLDMFSQALYKSFFHDGPLPGGAAPCPSFQNVRVHHAYQVMNFGLLQQYAGFCRRLKGRCQNGTRCDQAVYGEALPDLAWQLSIPLDAHINEHLLLHGTSHEVSREIAVNGWDGRLAADAGLYGRGTYFAVQSCKAHQYTKEDPKVCRTVLVARVALGTPFTTLKCDQGARRPPEGHDSVRALPGPVVGHQHGVQTHSEFIIYQHGGIQAYPDYILEYTLS